MKHHYICIDCVESETGTPIHDLSVELFNQVKAEMSFTTEACPVCGGNNVRKVFGIETAYVRGYGFHDKKGTKRDMDLHAMSTGNDPYGEHRKVGETREVITNLQRDREHHTHSKTIRM